MRRVRCFVSAGLEPRSGTGAGRAAIWKLLGGVMNRLRFKANTHSKHYCGNACAPPQLADSETQNYKNAYQPPPGIGAMKQDFDWGWVHSFLAAFDCSLRGAARRTSRCARTTLSPVGGLCAPASADCTGARTADSARPSDRCTTRSRPCSASTRPAISRSTTTSSISGAGSARPAAGVVPAAAPAGPLKSAERPESPHRRTPDIDASPSRPNRRKPLTCSIA